MITGRAAFSGNAMDIVVQKFEETPPRIRDHSPQTSREVDEMCAKMMALSPSERPGIEEIAEKIKALLKER